MHFPSFSKECMSFVGGVFWNKKNTYIFTTGLFLKIPTRHLFSLAEICLKTFLICVQ